MEAGREGNVSRQVLIGFLPPRCHANGPRNNHQSLPSRNRGEGSSCGSHTPYFPEVVRETYDSTRSARVHEKNKNKQTKKKTIMLDKLRLLQVKLEKITIPCKNH